MKFKRVCGRYLFLVGIIGGFSWNVNAQNTLGFRFTPNIIASPRVINPSPSAVFGERLLSFDAGVDFTHMFSKSLGINAGIDMGVIDWNVYLTAPVDAFGIGTGTGLIYYNSNSENFMYNAVSTQLVYSFNLGKSKIHSYLGPGLRYYHQQKENTIKGAVFNRITDYDPDDPNAGPPDLLIDIAPIGNRLHLNISTGIGIERRVSRQSNIVFGIRKNWGVKPLGDGSLLVQMYDELYNGSFSPRSNYVGIDLKFNYSLSKEPDRPQPADGQIEPAKYRKSVFAEALGSGLVISGNFDMRLKKNRNDGFGFRAGLGLGGFYRSIGEKGFGAARRYITFPVMVNYIKGIKRSGLETAIGFTSQVAFSKVAENEQSFIPYGSLNVGYRLQPLKDGLIVRAAWAPLFDNEGFHPAWAGVSIGYSFK